MPLKQDSSSLERLDNDQTSVKTDLEIVNAWLKKSSEHIHELEKKLRNFLYEFLKLKVKQKEDEKLWKGLEPNFSSTKTLCDQLTEALQQLTLQHANDKEVLDNKPSARSEALDGLNKQMDDLSLKPDSSEQTIRTQLKERNFLIEEREKLHGDEHSRAGNLIQEMGEIEN